MPLMFLNGGAMRGGDLHHLLRGAPLVGVVRTAPKYRFHSVGDRFPALEPGGGAAVVGELYDVPWEVLRDWLLPSEPDELELGVIELEDGSGSLSMLRRVSYREPDGAYSDISEFGDWRAYRDSQERS
jgi:gamma-glutamylcyclotransferase (GGCT)/AIG2-like uncharacterized protein YtfP